MMTGFSQELSRMVLTPSRRESVFKPAKILVVDDEGKIGLMLQEVLSEEGHEVRPFCYSLEALRALKSERYDLLLTDMKMPVMDGLELARQARRMDPELVIVMITGYASTETVIEALRLGVADYLTKPFEITELRKLVKRALETRKMQREERGLLNQLKQANLKLVKARNDLTEQITHVQANLTQTNTALERRVRELSMLNDVSRVVNSVLDLEKLLEVYLELVSTKIGIRNCSIMLLEQAHEDEESRQVLKLSAAIGRSAKKLSGQVLGLDGCIEGWVARNRIPVLIEELADPGRLHAHEACKYQSGSFICVPLLVKDRLLGVMDVNEKRSGEALNQDDLNLLTTIAGQVSIALENAKLYGVLQENALRTVQALASTLEAKDRYTSGHSERVTNYAVAVAEHMGLPVGQIDRLRYASQLHDVGKIGVPEEILRKPSSLDEGEWRAIQEHPVIGERIIKPLGFLGEVGRIIRHHHERWDGGGYPDRLSGAQIPKLTRIMTVVDAYDAMTSERPYRNAKSAKEAMEELKRCRGSQFDPEATDTFLSVLAEPVSTSAN